uniref:Uncharacterized protein n=1 Tax=Utricularia reniformis TaxID=192314 RepID=A0A1Y0B459_9LAMI|nr:hypothetical protein AEK19_MT2014 [Utricularia reniformis]ART32174.1 hypothetical protein AEK19_MT2014 [Utricularia reniformis]
MKETCVKKRRVQSKSMVIRAEESFFKQKSRVHLALKNNHQSKKQIMSVCNEDGTRVENPTEVKE